MFSGALPEPREQRWALLDDFIDRWFPARPEGAGVSRSELELAERRLGVPLPAAFREWFERSGARREVWSLQDELLMPHELEIESGVLTFCRENQNVVRWGIRVADLEREDPPVVIADPSGRPTWVVESPAISTFAIQFAAMNAKWAAQRGRANAQGTGEVFEAIEGHYARLPLPDMRWPADPTRFYGGPELIIETHARTWLWATARSREALEGIDRLVRGAGMRKWESYEP